MKKLFVTTALATAASAAVAGGDPYMYTEAEAPNYTPAPAAANVTHAGTALAVTLGGFSDFQAGFADADAGLELNDRDVLFQNDTELHVTAAARTDSGLEYGAVVELEADISQDGDSSDLNADKVYLFLQGDKGRVELGGNTGAQHTLKVDGSNISRATGGIAGDWYDFTSNAGVRPDNFSDLFRVGIEDAEKITYYTPRFSGFQLGASYTPDLGVAGTATSFAAAGLLFEDVIGAGINYAGDFGDFGLQASLTGETGDASAAGLEDLESWQVGVIVSAGDFQIGAGYNDYQETFGAGTDADSFNVAVAYDAGDYGLSVGYLDAEIAGGEQEVISVGADYQLAPGLVPYVEVNLVENGADDATVVLVGTELTF